MLLTLIFGAMCLLQVFSTSNVELRVELQIMHILWIDYSSQRGFKYVSSISQGLMYDICPSQSSGNFWVFFPKIFSLHQLSWSEYEFFGGLALRLT